MLIFLGKEEIELYFQYQENGQEIFPCDDPVDKFETWEVDESELQYLQFYANFLGMHF